MHVMNKLSGGGALLCFFLSLFFFFSPELPNWHFLGKSRREWTILNELKSSFSLIQNKDDHFGGSWNATVWKWYYLWQYEWCWWPIKTSFFFFFFQKNFEVAGFSVSGRVVESQKVGDFIFFVGGLVCVLCFFPFSPLCVMCVCVCMFVCVYTFCVCICVCVSLSPSLFLFSCFFPEKGVGVGV